MTARGGIPPRLSSRSAVAGASLALMANCSGSHLTTLASGRNVPAHVAVDATSVYWTDSGGHEVMKAPIGGGALTTLASEQAGPVGLAVDETNVYWANEGTDCSGSGCANPDGGAAIGISIPGSVMKVPIGGGDPTTLASGQARPMEVAIDGTHIYWINGGTAANDYTDGAIVKAPLEGGAPVTLASMQPSEFLGSGCVAVDSTSVYWAVAPQVNFLEGTVMKVPLDGGAPVTLASNQNVPHGIAVDARNVYWTTQGGSATGTVMQVPVAGGAPIALATGQPTAFGLAIDSTNVYWTNRSDPGSAVKVPIGGGALTTLVSGLDVGGEPQGIAVDAVNVYWTAVGHGLVMQTHK